MVFNDILARASSNEESAQKINSSKNVFFGFVFAQRSSQKGFFPFYPFEFLLKISDIMLRQSIHLCQIA